MPLLDQNQNQNQSIGVAMGVERRFRPRFNSDVESRLANVTIPDLLVAPILPGSVPHTPANPTYPPFHEYWDAELRAAQFLDDFRVGFPGGMIGLATAVRNQGFIPPNEMDRAELGGEVRQMLELGLEREARFSEVIDQDDGDGAINYWLGMLKIDPARHPATYLMVRLGRRIGEHVSMWLKGHFMSPRPSQVSPWITPMIDPPVTPSFPAGHAIQSYLMSFLLAYSFSNAMGQSNLPLVPQPFPPPGGPLPIFKLPPANAAFATFFPPPLNPQPSLGPLFHLAGRVSENRIVAGIHYPVDIRAGRFVAYLVFRRIRNVGSIWGGPGWDGPNQPRSLRGQVRGEFPQYVL